MTSAGVKEPFFCSSDLAGEGEKRRNPGPGWWNTEVEVLQVAQISQNAQRHLRLHRCVESKVLFLKCLRGCGMEMHHLSTNSFNLAGAQAGLRALVDVIDV